MNELLLIGGMALVTFLIRYPLFPLASQAEFPPFVTQALRYVPPAVLTAIIVPAVLMPTEAGLELSLSNSYLIGALVACGVGWTTKNLLATIVVGMAAFMGWQWWMVW